MNYVRQNNLSFLTTGGGHGYTDTLNSLQGGVELDMGNFNNVNIDSKDNIMTTGGAVRFTDITEELQAAGKEIREVPCALFFYMFLSNYFSRGDMFVHRYDGRNAWRRSRSLLWPLRTYIGFPFIFADGSWHRRDS